MATDRCFLLHYYGNPNLGQGFGRADADGHRNAGVASYRRLQVTGIVGQASPFYARQVEKCLIDTIDFDLGRFRGQRLHDAAAHIPVERVIRAEDFDAVAGEGLAVEVVGIAHRQAEGFRFVAAGDDAAVIVRQHNNRLGL
jgi:hypothetical protein